MIIDLTETYPTLSRRQRQVCAMLSEGLSTKIIAYKIGISPKTVEDHKTELFRKLGCTNAVQMVFMLCNAPEIRV